MISENYQTILWTVYGAGVLLVPVVTGYLIGKDTSTIDLLGAVLPIWMMGFLWPVLLALCIIMLVMIVIGVVMVVIGGIAMLPLLFGRFIRSLVDMETKKERKQK